VVSECKRRALELFECDDISPSLLSRALLDTFYDRHMQ